MLANPNDVPRDQVEHASLMFARGNSHDSAAYFYKLRYKDKFDYSKPHLFFGLADFNQFLEAKRNGAIYDPNNKGDRGIVHTWEVNLSWVFGLVEKKREIKIQSPIIFDSISSKKAKLSKDSELNHYSAFARELASARKAGYEFCFTNDEIVMQPPQSVASFSKESINPTVDDIKKTVTELLFLILEKKFGQTNLLENYLYECVDYIDKRHQRDDQAAVKDYDLICNVANNIINNKDKIDMIQLLNAVRILSDYGLYIVKPNSGLPEEIIDPTQLIGEAQDVIIAEPVVLETKLLFDAIYHGRTENVRVFLEQNPELLQVTDSSGDSPLHIASLYGRENIIDLLIKQFPKLIYLANNHGQTPHLMAAYGGESQVVHKLLSYDASLVDLRDEYGHDVFLKASTYGHIDLVTELFELYKDKFLQTKERHGWNVLQVAAYSPSVGVVAKLLKLHTWSEEDLETTLEIATLHREYAEESEEQFIRDRIEEYNSIEKLIKKELSISVALIPASLFFTKSLRQDAMLSEEELLSKIETNRF